MGGFISVLEDKCWLFTDEKTVIFKHIVDRIRIHEKIQDLLLEPFPGNIFNSCTYKEKANLHQTTNFTVCHYIYI